MPICALAAATRALGGGDVGTALQQRRRQPERHRGHARRPVGRRRALKSPGALPTSTAIACSSCARWPRSADEVGLRVGELRLRLQHVGLRGDAGVVAVLGDLQRALVAATVAASSADLRIGLAQREVVGRQLALGREAGRGEVGRAGLRAGAGAGRRRRAAGPRRRAPSWRRGWPRERVAGEPLALRATAPLRLAPPSAPTAGTAPRAARAPAHAPARSWPPRPRRSG